MSKGDVLGWVVLTRTLGPSGNDTWAPDWDGLLHESAEEATFAISQAVASGNALDTDIKLGRVIYEDVK